MRWRTRHPMREDNLANTCSFPASHRKLPAQGSKGSKEARQERESHSPHFSRVLSSHDTTNGMSVATAFYQPQRNQQNTVKWLNQAKSVPPLLLGYSALYSCCSTHSFNCSVVSCSFNASTASTLARSTSPTSGLNGLTAPNHRTPIQT